MPEKEQQYSEHEISDKTAKLAQKHAEISLKHAKTIEKIGKSLQQGDCTPCRLRDREEGKSIEEYGKKSEEYARACLKHAKDTQDQHGRSAVGSATQSASESYNLAVQEHVKQNQEHIRANKEYSKMLEKHLKNSKTLLNKNT
ncbi:MAG: hypothetical protein ACRC11_19160 [Xenococcaceae cyanobacterium]